MEYEVFRTTQSQHKYQFYSEAKLPLVIMLLFIANHIQK